MHRVLLVLQDILSAITGLFTGDPGTLTNPTDITVNDVSASILAANTSRVSFMVQNTGAETIRVGIGITPTSTRGIQLKAGATLTMDSPFPITSAINAIREGSSNSTVSVVEVTS